MTTLAIVKALEKRLKELSPDFPTAWENSDFSPTAGVAYQQVNTLFAEPENPTMGADFYRQRGYLQVTLRYPQNDGKAAAFGRADLLRSWFKRGLSLTIDDVTTIIERTPEVTAGSNEGDRYVVIVRVRFFANILDTDDAAGPDPRAPEWSESNW